METISAPNGTKFLKPDFECNLYEESSLGIHGTAIVNEQTFSCTWNLQGIILHISVDSRERIHKYDLIPAPQPWYENLSKGKLCWVWNDKNPDHKTSAIVTNYFEHERYKFQSSLALFTCAQPLTSEEVQAYIVKDK